MAKLIGPLFSVGASGSVGPRITIRATKSGHQAVNRSRPGSKNKAAASAGQLAQRAKYRLGIAVWQAFDASSKLVWGAIGALDRMSGWNAFLRDYLTATPGGTTWDGGTTTWDGGATLWD